MKKDITTVSLKLIKQFLSSATLGSRNSVPVLVTYKLFPLIGKISVSLVFQSDKIEFQGYP